MSEPTSEAVEAAARAYCDAQGYAAAFRTGWDGLLGRAQQQRIAYMRAALKAAYPKLVSDSLERDGLVEQLAGVRAERDRLKACSEWKPIETAPRDGTVVDLWVVADGCEFRATDFVWTRKGWKQAEPGDYMLELAFGNPGMRPTLWRESIGPDAALASAGKETES
jgi:hypothetical protein